MYTTSPIAAAQSTDPIIVRPPKPQLSLGLGVVDWCESWLLQPDGPDAGDPFRFTPEQVAFVWRLYAVDERGRFLWSRGVFRRSKGHGKSPFLAALALAELLGPVRFSHFDASDQPVGKHVTLPWVQLAGVSEKQTQNTLSVLLAMISPDLIATYGVDPGITRVYVAGGGKLEPITASAPTAEGARPTFVVMDETHHWTASNGGHKLAEVIRRNLGKSRDGAARSIETTNAHAMGLDSTAERSYEAWVKQTTGATARTTILYDSREAPPDVNMADEPWLMAVLKGVYGDSTWVDLERIRDEIYDPSTPPSDSRRFYLNQLSAVEDAWIRPTQWDALASTHLRLLDGELIALGFDGSKTEDHSVLWACRISDGACFVLGHWDPAAHGGEVPRDQVDETVNACKDRYDVVGFYADLHPFEAYIDKWAMDFDALDKRQHLCARATTKHAIGWDMRGRGKDFTIALARVFDEIVETRFQHDGNPIARQHVHNARRRTNSWGVTVGKETRESTRRIDAVPALVLARLARADYLALPNSKQRRVKTGHAMF